MFDPSVGRWNTPDPIGFETGDPNLYRYVGNSPTNFTDPSGQERHPRGAFDQPYMASLLFDLPHNPPGTQLTQTLVYETGALSPGVSPTMLCVAWDTPQVLRGKEDITRSYEEFPARRNPQKTLNGSEDERQAAEAGTDTFIAGATIILIAPAIAGGGLAEAVVLAGRGGPLWPGGRRPCSGEFTPLTSAPSRRWAARCSSQASPVRSEPAQPHC